MADRLISIPNNDLFITAWFDIKFRTRESQPDKFQLSRRCEVVIPLEKCISTPGIFFFFF